MQTTKVIEFIINWLQQYVKDNESIKGFVVGVSGGIDSALVSTLCAKTGLPLLVLELPIHQMPQDLVRSGKHVAWLKQQHPGTVRSHLVNLNSAFEAVEATLTSTEKTHHLELALANSRARLRMVIRPFLLVVSSG